MKKNNGRLLPVITDVLIFAFYNLCVFLLVRERAGAFWTAYIFTLIALLVQLAVSAYISKNPGKADNLFLGIPIATFSMIYYIAQVIIAGILLFLSLGVRAVVIVEAAVMIFFMIIILATISMKDVVGSADENTARSTSFIRMYTSKAEELLNREKDADRRKELQRLYDAFRYSDPVTNNQQVRSAEGDIEAAFLNHFSDCDSESTEELKGNVDDILILIQNRNALCRMNK